MTASSTFVGFCSLSRLPPKTPNMSAYNPSTAAPRTAGYGAPVPIAAPTPPPGTFAPGTKIHVGNHKVVVQKYFSEGGFAHVYLVKLAKPIDGSDIAVLKRVAVPDKEALASMRTEVETMKKLKGHRPIVTYYDSHASQLKGGGYEVFLLMEFCNGGGLIDFMNTRLQNRLTEPEILKIFTDVAEGVACMHYLKPPLLHRDLKVENVLITSTGSSKRFKLCDFGSTAPPRPAATTAAECRLIEEDVQKHTTLQYRSPEMIDVYRKLPIDEKSDIWALGVLLYKLCYYTTPFEEQGQLAILNASYKFPAYPVFSDKLKLLIASMLKEKPPSRPNIYQVLREGCLMRGIEVPIQDIYAGRTQSESRRNQQLPPHPQAAMSPTVGAVYSPPLPQQQIIPDVVPMRRGRPTVGAPTHAAHPSPSPMRVNDPWAALDAGSGVPTTDDVAARFPSLDQFSLLHERGGKFDFEASSPVNQVQSRDISQRVTEKLADDAFAMSSRLKTPSAVPPGSTVSLAQKIISSNPELQAAASQPLAPIPVALQRTMVSQGTMTSSPSSPAEKQVPKFNPQPVQRFPSSNHHRSTSLPRNQEASVSKHYQTRPEVAPEAKPDKPDDRLPTRPSNLTSFTSFQSRTVPHVRQASSSRPSLEGGRPSYDTAEPIARTKSNPRARPSSTYLESSLDYIRPRENTARSGHPTPRTSTEIAVRDDPETEETNIQSNVDFLRSMEGSDTKDRRRSSIAKPKRTSLPSLTNTTKNLFAGKFGDAFKRFEHNANAPPLARTPSPLQGLERRDLTPIAGSEATDGRSDDGQVLEETEDMPPEMRRELERRRLSQEERRVATAAAEYRKRLADRDAGGVSSPKPNATPMTRAASIQSKVKSLLDENQKPSPTKTAEGYGRFTDTASTQQMRKFDEVSNPYVKAVPIARKPIVGNSSTRAGGPNHATLGSEISVAKTRTGVAASAPPNLTPIHGTGGARPSAPPKPTHLNGLPTGGPNMASGMVNGSPPKALPARPLQARPDMTPAEREDYVRDFSKRFPSLSAIEMVETEIGVGKVKDV